MQRAGIIGSGGASATTPVLCVDLDGTLIRTDLLWECGLAALRQPAALISAIAALPRGKAEVKRRLAEEVGSHISIAALPYDRAVLDLVRSRKAAGWRVELVSAADQSLVSGVATHLGCFDAAFGSDGARNLSGPAKAAFMAERHPGGYGYIGNAAADREPWREAAKPLAANAPAPLLRRMRAEGINAEIVSEAPPLAPALLRAMRLHQWGKNLLLFVAFFLSFERLGLGDLALILGAFLAFGLLASATYIINDLLDLEADRQHPSKRDRPFASGEAPIPAGLALSAVLMIAGLALGVAVGTGFLLHLVAYTVLTLAYSLALKSVAILDVLALGLLFSLRVLAGTAAIGAEITPWLTTFTLLFFSSLALAKRHVEMVRMAGSSAGGRIAGRGYLAEDRLFAFGFGAALAVASLLVFLLYAFSGEANAFNTINAAMVCLGAMTYWVMRVWLLTLRGEMNDDPVLFAVRDPVSYACGGVVMVALLADRLLT